MSQDAGQRPLRRLQSTGHGHHLAAGVAVTPQGDAAGVDLGALAREVEGREVAAALHPRIDLTAWLAAAASQVAVVVDCLLYTSRCV